MEQIDVHDLPEPVARAILAMVEALRDQFTHSAPAEEPRELPLWEGQVLGNLAREGIYDDDLGGRLG
ncbi:MAG TPA: hypothetical protein VJ739_07225 [Gemmataceae bacterium]|nr:hypothetical protein [Gemmataceae bacterium]